MSGADVTSELTSRFLCYSLKADTRNLRPGRYPALVELLQSSQQGDMVLPVEVFLVVVGFAEASFLSVKQESNTDVFVSASVSLSTAQLGLSVSTAIQLSSTGKSFCIVQLYPRELTQVECT